MIRAVALRLDRLLLDTKSTELGFFRDMCAILHEYAGVSPSCVVEQMSLINAANLDGSRFRPDRWHSLAETLRYRLAFQVGDDPHLIKDLADAAEKAKLSVPEPTVHADLIIETVRNQGVRVFGYSYGDTAMYRQALNKWPGASKLTDVLLMTAPEYPEWETFWQQHDCDTAVDGQNDQPMLVITPDPFYDPPMAFRIGSPVVLMGTRAQGPELPAVPGPLEVLAILSDLPSLK